MLGQVFERFIEKSPISVMVRAALERVLSADRLDLWYRRTAQKQYTRALLFSTVYELMSQVVFCVQPSVRAAYRAHEADVGTSIISVYNALLTASQKWTFELPMQRTASWRHVFEANVDRFAMILQVHGAKPIDNFAQQASIR